MSKVNRLRLFVASPGDVQVERRHVAEVTAQLNRTVAADHGMVIEIVAWETHARPGMGRLQGLVNKQVGAYDILVGIMWRRFGTPTGVAESGTEEEFRLAYRLWEETNTPQIFFYFSEVPAAPPRTVDEVTQLLNVVRFREEVQAKGLVWTYPSPSDFKDLLHEHLHRLIVDELSQSAVTIANRLLAVLNLEKERCRQKNVPFYTPNLLHALLEIKCGVAQRALNELDRERAAEIRLMVKNYDPTAAPGKGELSFSDFNWEERPEVERALQRAREEGRTVVRQRELLLGLLETPSSTQARLKEMITEESFTRLLAIVAAATEEPPGNIGRTPGI